MWQICPVEVSPTRSVVPYAQALGRVSGLLGEAL